MAKTATKDGIVGQALEIKNGVAELLVRLLFTPVFGWKDAGKSVADEIGFDIVTITHQTVLGEDGKPTAALIPYAQFVELVETYGLDFTDEERKELREALDDVKDDNREAFVGLDEIKQELGCTE
ncbi:MAG: hypothetical protein AAF591_00565 [Verrucomicrobiota bacterium]